MSKYDDAVAELTSKREAAASARKARDEKEYLEKVHPLLMDRDDVEVLPVPGAAPGFVGHVVLRRPSKGEMDRFRFTRFKDARSTDAVESKAKAGGELAVCCVVYPERAEYLKLIEAYPGVSDEAAAVCITSADAAADAAKKK